MSDMPWRDTCWGIFPYFHMLVGALWPSDRKGLTCLLHPPLTCLLPSTHLPRRLGMQESLDAASNFRAPRRVQTHSRPKLQQQQQQQQQTWSQGVLGASRQVHHAH